MNADVRGLGRIFTNPDPDQARSFYRDHKREARSMHNKIMDLDKAIHTYVHDDDYLAIGGFGSNRTPVAACHEIVRQKKKHLGFLGHTSTHDMQILSSGQVYNRIDISYGVGLEARGLSLCSRRYMESGQVEITEWTNYALTARLKAASMGIPFMPVREMIGTDTLTRSGAVQTTCPFTNRPVALVPALYPDVTVIHAHEADCYGNARFRGIAVSDIELAHASKRLIITAERIVSHEEISRDPGMTHIPFYLVDAVCAVPFGAYPGGMPYEYFSDEENISEWLLAEKDDVTFRDFLNREIYDCKTHNDYLNLHGGSKRMKTLRLKEFFLDKEANRENV